VLTSSAVLQVPQRCVTEVHCGLDSLNLISQIRMNPKPSERRQEPHRAAVVAGVNLNRRRSSRIALTAAIELSGEDSQKCCFTMPARATNLNKHGASVKLNRDLLVGSVVVVRNRRGRQVSACVVTRLVTLEGVSTYAIEFVEQDNRAKTFWEIAFP
jgi:hypothetical protein